VAESLAEERRTLDLWEDAFDGHAPKLRAGADRIAPSLVGGPVQALHGDRGGGEGAAMLAAYPSAPGGGGTCTLS
jgi:hypothetical protein